MTEGLGQRSSLPHLPGKMPTPQMMLNLAGAGTPGDIKSPAMPPAWVSRLRIPLSPPASVAVRCRGIPSGATAVRRPLRPHELLARRLTAAAVPRTAYAYGYLPAIQ